VFGGLLAIAVGIGIAYGGSLVWKEVRPHLSWFKKTYLTVAQAITPTDGTSISGFSRTVRYSASEEEEILDVASRSKAPSLFEGISASGYIIRNITRGVTIDERSADRTLPIASLTKLITAVVAQRSIDPEERVIITRSIMSTYGNTAQFKIGETFPAKDLYYPLLMVSSNDAAEALAQAHGRQKFIEEMNELAQSIGAYRTYFDDPSGLSPHNISTAWDMVLILEWVRTHYPDVIAITTEKTRVVRAHTWINPTHFLNWSTYIGGKNGYIPEAALTGASLFRLGPNKDIYAVVVLGSDSRDGDVIKLLEKVN